MNDNASKSAGGSGTVTLDELRDLVAELGSRVAELEEENAHLRLQLAVMTSTDPVTGLANRAGIVDSIEVALHRLVRMKEPFAVVGVRFPELAGLQLTDDRIEAIRDLGALLAASLRNVDRVGRLDDTTFVVALADVPADHVMTVTTRTRATLERLPSMLGIDVQLTPTLAAISVVDPEEVPTVSSVVDTLESLIDTGDDTVHVL